MGPARYAIFLPSNEWVQPVVFGLQAGSPILKDDARFGAFSDSAFRRAFEFYVGLYRSGLAPVAGNNDIANPYQEFGRGMFAQWITGPWNIGEFERRLPADQQNAWGTAPLPGPDAGTPGISLAGGSSLVLFRGSRHPAEAWQLIEFLSRPEQQVRFYHLTGDLPARTAAWRDSSLIGNPHARAFWEQLHRVKPTPQVPEWELIVTKVFDYAELSIRGGKPIDSTLAALDRDVNEVLAKRRWLLAREAGR
jgi:multiple sugar transport system substrate-binding protein